MPPAPKQMGRGATSEESPAGNAADSGAPQAPVGLERVRLSGDHQKMRAWLLASERESQVPEEKKQPWWKVMCLTGVDYFSTLGYQPAIAALAAGALSPIATLVLIAVTLFGALPVYRRIAKESPHGQGSLALLEKLLPKWKSKLLVLGLLGFAATDFMITITLSTADASAHVIENPFAPEWLESAQVPLTLFFLALLAAVFLRGFREAIGVAVILVGVFLALNLVVILVAMGEVLQAPGLTDDWFARMGQATGGNWVLGVAIALILFPKLALGMSGFETGVAVMPQVRGKVTDTVTNPTGRIAGTKKLLTTAALIMSGFLLTSSIVTTILIPPAEFQEGGSANGRALAYLAHKYLGDIFGTAYDISTIAILWFAGASAMAAMLNLVPRYLPKYGMAPNWANAARPLVIVLTLIGVVITLIFQADVNAQGAAYATGVLVLISSASIAVLISAWRRRQKPAIIGFGAITLVFLYTTIANIVERPDGLKIALIFTAIIVIVSFLSRIRRSLELRASDVHMDQRALEFVSGADEGTLRIIAHEPRKISPAAYRRKLWHACNASNIPQGEPFLFIEVDLDDASEFEKSLEVKGIERNGFRILQVQGNNVPNTIAAVLLHIRDITGVMPHVYFRWTEGSPLRNMFKFLFFGEGEIAPVTREVLREAEPNVERRPWVHVS